jgi:hypothetical protein
MLSRGSSLFWLVGIFASAQPENHIFFVKMLRTTIFLAAGADNTGPIERQSYWYSDNNPPGWSQWLFNDWMMRMTLRLGTGIESDIVSGLPTKIALSQNYPNPFNPTTSIRFALPNPTSVKIAIFNALGQRIRELANGHYDAGYHVVTWDGRTDDDIGVPSGVYYYHLDAGDYRISKKMTVLK